MTSVTTAREINMSQDLARQQTQRGPNGSANYAPADDLWMQQQALAMTGNGGGAIRPGGGEVQPLKVVHRSLRGRYKLAILLAAVGASVGTVLGWTSFERSFRGKGLIRIQPDVQTVGLAKENGITDYTRYMGSEASFLKTEEIAKRAMGRPEWVKAAGDSAWQPADFMSHLTATYVNSAQEILVGFDSPNPQVAAAGMKATLFAYQDYRNEQRVIGQQSTADWLESQKRSVQADIDALYAKKTAIMRDNDKGNIEERARIKGAALAQMESQRDDAQLVLTQMEAVVKNAGKTPQAMSEQMLAHSSPYFARMIEQRDQVKQQLLAQRGILGPGNPQVQKLDASLEMINRNIAEMAADAAKKSYGFILPLARGNGPANNEPIEVNDATVANQRDNLAMLNAEIEARQKDLSSVDGTRFTIAELTNQIARKRDDLGTLDVRLNAAREKSQPITMQFTVSPDPTASIQEDKRPTMATFGFVAGAGIPLMGLVLFGLMDRKYRYSDEATASGGTRGVPLLGILPNLPDRLSDPSQASVAAHCVHQIRQMLQLNCLREGPNVICVTSATSGDGKTSLSLALGLSFAASGSRTLLIDTDLIGGGLSARLGIREPAGISEAIATRDPMQYVRETDVADLSVLPVGTNGPQNASSFSPTAVRRLIEACRAHFDLILIDTGPVLGSLEATPVVAASDAVILTVARGQNRDLVEKAIGYLRTIGARVAGVVFNKANTGDFERSISGISLRSVSRSSANGSNGYASQNGKHQDGRLGPLVHSVRGTREDVA